MASLYIMDHQNRGDLSVDSAENLQNLQNGEYTIVNSSCSTLGHLVIFHVIIFTTYLVLLFAADDSSRNGHQEHGTAGKDQTHRGSEVVKQTTIMKETIVTKIINNEQPSNVSNEEGQREEITNKESHVDITEHNTQKKNIKNSDFDNKDVDRAIRLENVTPRVKSTLSSQISSSTVYQIEHTSLHPESQSQKVPAIKDTHEEEKEKATAGLPVGITTPNIHRQSSIMIQSTPVYFPTSHDDVKHNIPENIIADKNDASEKAAVLVVDVTTPPVTTKTPYKSTTTTPAILIRLSTSDILRQKMINGNMVNGNDDAENMLEGNVEEQNKICLLYTSPSPRDATLSRMPSSA